MARTYQEWLKELRAAHAEVGPEDLVLRLRADSPPLILDVRERDEWLEGHLPLAQHVPRGFLELRIEAAEPDRARPIVVYCAGGVRSLFAAEALQRLGYQHVESLRGGFGAWKQGGHPFEMPRALGEAERRRYARHLSIPEVGEAGQLRLMESRVLLVGAGGLGSPAAIYLAAAGVGTLGLIDDDVVDTSNLQRQILHTEDRVGVPKVDSAEQTLKSINSGVTVQKYRQRLSRANVDEIFPHYDLIVDGADNFATRYLINDACVKHGMANVHGSVFRFEGQISVFWPGKGPCYRCLYPEPPPPGLAPSCAEAGVLGVLPGVVGMLEAVEAIKLLLGIGEPLVGRLLIYDALRAQFRELRLHPDPRCPYCAPGTVFPGYADYEEFCGGP